MSKRFVVLIPAGGVGARFGGTQPKQYTMLCGQTVLQHTVARFLAVPEVAHIGVVVAPSDHCIDQVYAPHGLPEKVRIWRCGGETRAESVRNGLAQIMDEDIACASDWVLVHDAARCCVPLDAIQRLLAEAGHHPVGGLLAVPMADTVKKADISGQVCATIDRSGLWQAQTPQMFRAGLLQQALNRVDISMVTDESSAIEALGKWPLLVEGDVRNIKLTRPSDAVLAELLLMQEQKI